MAMTEEQLYLEGKIEGLRIAVEAFARLTMGDDTLRTYIGLLRHVSLSSVSPEAAPRFQQGFEDLLRRMATSLRET